MHILGSVTTFAAITVAALRLTAGPVQATVAIKPLEDRIVVQAMSAAPAADTRRTDFALAA